MFQALIDLEKSSEFKWEPYAEEKHGQFFHDVRRPPDLGGEVNQWIVQIVHDPHTNEKTALSSILMNSLKKAMARRFLKSEKPEVCRQDTDAIFTITRCSSSLRRTHGCAAAPLPLRAHTASLHPLPHFI